MTNRGRLYQPTTIKALRKLHDLNDTKAKVIVAEANKLLETAATHAALARDAATLLAEADPEWKDGGDESPEGRRAQTVIAWRDALNVIELHPELHLSGYDSLSVHQADGEVTPEFVASLEQHGFTIRRTETRISAEMWFGDYAVKLRASANIEPPAVEPEPFIQASPAEVAQAYEVVPKPETAAA
jgi:hypothetical protein